MSIKRKLGLIAASAVTALTMTGWSAAAMAADRAPAIQAPPLTVYGYPGPLMRNFNPFSESTMLGSLSLIYEPLFYFNTVGSQVYPLLGLKYAWSNGNKVLTVDLRRNVRWTDGKPFTAQDVAFTFNYLKKNPALDLEGVWTALSSVTAEGPYTVRFTFKTVDVPYSWYILGQTPIVPEHIWSKVANPTKFLNPNPVGTGPYKFTSFNPEEYTFTANPHYWGGESKVHELLFPNYLGGTSAQLGLLSGKIDWAGINVPNIQTVYVNRDPKYNHYWFAPASIDMLLPNLRNPLLASLPVREALSLGINRAKLYAAEYKYSPIASPTGLTLPNFKEYLAPGLPKQDLTFAYNPQKAEQILTKAGFKKNASGIFTSPSGKPLSFTLQVVNSFTVWDVEAAIIAQELKQVGIQVTVNEESWAVYQNNMNVSRNFQLALSFTSTGPTPFYLYNNLLRPNQMFNAEGWNNPATNAALNMFQQTSNPKVQKQAIYRIEKIMATQLPAIGLFEQTSWNEYSDRYYTGWPTAKDPYAVGGPWSFPMEIILMHLRPR